MEAQLARGIFEALSQGDLSKVAGYAAIFFLVWFEVRGLKKELKNLNVTIGKSFADGEKRFDAIEHRIELIETIQRGDHGNIEKANFAGV